MLLSIVRQSYSFEHDKDTFGTNPLHVYLLLPTCGKFGELKFPMSIVCAAVFIYQP